MQKHAKRKLMDPTGWGPSGGLQRSQHACELYSLKSLKEFALPRVLVANSRWCEGQKGHKRQRHLHWPMSAVLQMPAPETLVFNFFWPCWDSNS